MHPFDRGISLERTDDATYRGRLDRSWWIDFGPNGGFIASIMLHAIMIQVSDEERSPRSLSVHYPGRAREGDFEVEVQIERAGRSMTFASARMSQDGSLLTIATCALSRSRPSEEFSHATMPDAVAPEDIQEAIVPEGMLPQFAANFDYRFATGSFPYSGAEEAAIGGWIRPKDPRLIDALIVPTFADGFPPAVFGRARRPFPIPTIDLTVHLRSSLPLADADATDWSFASFSSRHGSGGFIEEDGWIWSRDGRLLAQSRQLAIYGTEMGEAPFGR